jgi:hypothetical protein
LQRIVQVEISGSTAPRAHGQIAGQVRLGAGREGGHLFMPDTDPLNLALATDRIGQPVEAVANDTVDPLLHPLRLGFGLGAVPS